VSEILEVSVGRVWSIPKIDEFAIPIVRSTFYQDVEHLQNVEPSRLWH